MQTHSQRRQLPCKVRQTQHMRVIQGAAVPFALVAKTTEHEDRVADASQAVSASATWTLLLQLSLMLSTRSRIHTCTRA